MEKDEIKEETQIVKARFKETFANNLGRIRSERELSQEKLADMAGISLSVVSNYENKKKLASALYAKKLATALDVSGCSSVTVPSATLSLISLIKLRTSSSTDSS